VAGELRYSTTYIDIVGSAQEEALFAGVAAAQTIMRVRALLCEYMLFL
jgi:hypothetical protein